MRTEFKPEEHRKYHAATYFQSGTLLPMKDAQRSNLCKQAYQDFTNGLADISQREPISAEHTGQGAPGLSKEDLAKLSRQAQWERLIQDRYAADCTWRYKERLRRRVAAYYAIKNGEAPISAAADFRNGIPIRRDTAALLTALPEADNNFADVAMTAVTLLLYIYGLCDMVRALWALPPSETVATTLLGVDLSPSDAAWLCLLVKELGFVLLTPMGAVCEALGGLAGRALAPLAPPGSAGRRVWDESVAPALAEQARLGATLVKSLSTVRRAAKLAEQVRDRECNPSFKDYDNVLLNFANVVFQLVLLLAADRTPAAAAAAAAGSASSSSSSSSAGGGGGGGGAGGGAGGGTVEAAEVYPILISLGLLLKNFAAQRLCMRKVYQSLKDLNENRLSKFELALLLTKLSEIVLTEDVQYNFVHHLYTGRDDPLDPDVGPLPDEDPAGLRRAAAAAAPQLPDALAREFGHDMLWEYADYSGPARPYSVELTACPGAPAPAAGGPPATGTVG